MSAADRDARARRADALLRLLPGSAVPGGFAWLDDDGRPTGRDLPLWVTCRMTHCAALGELRGSLASGSLASGSLASGSLASGSLASGALVEHGLDALLGPFHDDRHGGWWAALARDDLTPTATRKEGYGHAFVVLAASSALAAGHDRAQALLAEALAVQEEHFWEEGPGLVRESWDAAWTSGEDYRGANATMHTVEAYLAASDATGDDLWRARAGRMAQRVVDGWARANGWRVPEHFTASWEPLLEHHADAPAHPFRPYGATVGHALEWARLVLAADAALSADGGEGLPWATEAAVALAERAVADGWAVDGAPGFVYTTDWEGRPVVDHRMHWVLAEAVGAAAALAVATDDPVWDRRAQQWWRYADEHLVDHARGSWRHELDARNVPASTTWEGRPDLYHALQACLVRDLPLHPSFATALAVTGREHADR
ncbi:AGE family epimerase/isomerase [Pseudokineococcus basanitobsidens]|uniref:AGE family epimerase/isomerase n=1 Tax=Pseudokineococcus basanitobsidens TaxID=1926649 RepID=A0ABU8RKI0_9ACTN